MKLGRKRGSWQCCYLLTMKQCSTMYNKELSLSPERCQVPGRQPLNPRNFPSNRSVFITRGRPPQPQEHLIIYDNKMTPDEGRSRHKDQP